MANLSDATHSDARRRQLSVADMDMRRACDRLLDWTSGREARVNHSIYGFHALLSSRVSTAIFHRLDELVDCES